MNYFKTWPKKQTEEIEDLNNLSDITWRRMELLHATDYPDPKYDDEQSKVENDIDWNVPDDCPF